MPSPQVPGKGKTKHKWIIDTKSDHHLWWRGRDEWETKAKALAAIEGYEADKLNIRYRRKVVHSFKRAWVPLSRPSSRGARR